MTTQSLDLNGYIQYLRQLADTLRRYQDERPTVVRQKGDTKTLDDLIGQTKDQIVGIVLTMPSE